MLILLLTLLLTPQEKTFFTCKVTEPTTVVCNVRHPDPACVNNPAKGCKTQVLEGFDWNVTDSDGSRVFEEWLWSAPVPQNYNLNLIQGPPPVGKVLRATLNHKGFVKPLPDCEVAEWREANDRGIRDKPGESPGMVGLPEGCPLTRKN